MEIITGTEAELIKMINEAKVQYRNSKNQSEKCALYLYIDRLYRVLDSVGVKKHNQPGKFLNEIRRIKYNKMLDKYLKVYLNSFIENKEFHNEYLGNMLDAVNGELNDFLDSTDSKKDIKISKDDFYMIFFDFLKTLGLENLFDDFIKGNKIFLKQRKYNSDYYDFEGLVLHNPVNGCMAVVSNNFQCQLNDMWIWAHEFGHVYDLSKLNGVGLAEKALRLAHSSVYSEVVSRMFERLFFKFLISNNIMVEQAKELFENSLFDHRDYIWSSYILSCLDDKHFNSDGEIDLGKQELFDFAFEYFDDYIALQEFIAYKSFDIYVDVLYGYGEVMSVFLKDSVEKDGLGSELMRDFMECRTEKFTPQFIENHSFDVKSYKKIYRQDVELLKK